MEESYANELLEEVRKNYDKIAKKFSQRRKDLWPEMNFLVDNFVESDDKILDIGCGNGRLLKRLRGKSVRYVGIDFSKALINEARNKFPGYHFQIANAINLPFPNNSFDKVYAIAFLHHIPSKKARKQVIKESKRVLKERGLLILTVWNLLSKRPIRKKILKNFLLKIIGKVKLDVFDIFLPWMGKNRCFFHCFRRGELRSLIKEADLRIIKSGSIIVPRKRKNYNLYVVAKK